MVALLLVVVTACAGQLFAKTCDQPAVTFNAGKLSASSNGCSLQQVLDAISRQTGIEIVMPPSAGTVPVFGVVGPSDPARVISELLDGSPFNCTLTAKSDKSGGLVRVVLTERVAFVPDKVPAASAGNAGALGKLTSAGAQDPNQKQDEDKDDGSTVALASVDSRNGEGQRRPQIDGDTLKKLPPLPPGIPTAMWQLYPSIVANGGVVPSGPAIFPDGQPAAPITPLSKSDSAQPTGPVPFDPATAPKGVINQPQLPPGIDPAMGKLYPWNLMQLIHGPIQQPSGPTLPMAPPIPFGRP